LIALAGKTDSKGSKKKGSTYISVPKENYTWEEKGKAKGS